MKRFLGILKILKKVKADFGELTERVFAVKVVGKQFSEQLIDNDLGVNYGESNFPPCPCNRFEPIQASRRVDEGRFISWAVSSGNCLAQTQRGRGQD